MLLTCSISFLWIFVATSMEAYSLPDKIALSPELDFPLDFLLLSSGEIKVDEAGGCDGPQGE